MPSLQEYFKELKNSQYFNQSIEMQQKKMTLKEVSYKLDSKVVAFRCRKASS